jgi:uncharacterized protein
MLTVDLLRLSRERTLPVRGRISADPEAWVETDLSFAGDLEVEGEATMLALDEVLVRAVVNGVQEGECRRCLKPVTRPFRSELALYFAPAEEIEDDGETRPIEPADSEIDLRASIREELILGLPHYLLCDESCPGLCSSCGAPLVGGACGCEVEEVDPRWASLRALTE